MGFLDVLGITERGHDSVQSLGTSGVEKVWELDSLAFIDHGCLALVEPNLSWVTVQ